MRSKSIFFLLLCLCISTAWSQTRKVTSRVIAETIKQSLSGVSATVKGTEMITTTNTKGKFSILIPGKLNVVLVLSFVGYKCQEMKVCNRSTESLLFSEGTNQRHTTS